MPVTYHIKILKEKIERKERRYLFEGMSTVGVLRDSPINDSILLNVSWKILQYNCVSKISLLLLIENIFYNGP